MVAHASSLSSEHTQTMCFVHVDAGIVFLLQANDFRQVSQITFHREHAIYHNQFDGIRFTLLELFFQGIHVVVFILQLGSKRKTTSVHDRSMVTVITNNVIATSGQLRNHTFINRKSGRETQCFIFTDELCKFFFKFYMNIQRSIQQTRTRASCTIFASSSNSRVDDSLIMSQTHIGI